MQQKKCALVSYSSSSDSDGEDKPTQSTKASLPEKVSTKLPDVKYLLTHVNTGHQSKAAALEPRAEVLEEAETYNNMPPPEFTLKDEGDVLKQMTQSNQRNLKRRFDTDSFQIKPKQPTEQPQKKQPSANLNEPEILKYHKVQAGENTGSKDKEVEATEPPSTKDTSQQKPKPKMFVPPQINQKKKNISTEF